jgi:hypothetical protein
VPLAGAAAQHPGPPLPRQGPAVAARRPAAALDERASAAPPGSDQGPGSSPPGQHAAAPASSRPAPGQKPTRQGRFAAHHPTSRLTAAPPSRPYPALPGKNCRLATGTEVSPGYPNLTAPRFSPSCGRCRTGHTCPRSPRTRCAAAACGSRCPRPGTRVTPPASLSASPSTPSSAATALLRRSG